MILAISGCCMGLIHHWLLGGVTCNVDSQCCGAPGTTNNAVQTCGGRSTAQV